MLDTNYRTYSNASSPPTVHKYGRIRSMAITIEEIEKLASLSRIELTESEKGEMQGEFDAILGYVASVNKVAEDNNSDAQSSTSTVNILREDDTAHESGLHTETLLSSAPKREGQYVKVKKIL